MIGHKRIKVTEMSKLSEVRISGISNPFDVVVVYVGM